MAHDHEHSHSRRGVKSFLHASKSCRLGFALTSTIVFFFVELICGYLFHSVAMSADAIHMLSDSSALIIAMVSVRISKRKSTKNTFGWIRAQELGAMVNCILLISLCFTILVQAVKRLISQESVDKNHLLHYVLVAAIGLGINILSLLILGGDMAHGHSHGGHGHSHGGKTKKSRVKDEDALEAGDHEHLFPEERCIGHDDDHHGHSHSPKSSHAKNHSGVNDGNGNVKTHQAETEKTNKQKKQAGLDGGQMNVRGAFLHVLNDALGSVVLICAGLAMLKWPEKAWVHYIDPIASLVMLSMIVIFTIPLLKESALVLLQTAPMHIEVAELQKRLVEQVPGVLSVHEFHVWQLSGSKIIASAHIRCHNLSEYMGIAEQVKDFFHREGIHSTTIQPEFIDQEIIPSTVTDRDCILECLQDCSVNTCCGQPSTYLKQRSPRTDATQTDSQLIPEQQSSTQMTVPTIEIIAPTRSNSYVE